MILSDVDVKVSAKSVGQQLAPRRRDRRPIVGEVGEVEAMSRWRHLHEDRRRAEERRRGKRSVTL